MIRLLFVVSLIALLVACENEIALADNANPASSSNNFEVENRSNGPSTDQVLRLCEESRSELFRVWGGDQAGITWEPRCKIRVHPTRADYSRRIGFAGGQTNGCSSIEFRDGKVVVREIDLLLDQAGELPALPHELTHIVLADLLRGRQPPHWLDEGVAMLADTTAKQHLHLRDCRDAISAGKTMALSQLLPVQSFSSADQMPTFYGQSLLLVRMLAEQSSPAKVIEFANSSLDHGTEVALKSHYQIANLDALERKWQSFAFHQLSLETPAVVVSVRFKP